jgi:hypothetical protein
MKIHLISHGETMQKWNQFLAELFKQQGFIGSESSMQAIKTQWNNRILIYKKKLGHEDGRTANLSGEEGDLNEVDEIIKNMLNEVSEEEARKEAVNADKEKVNQTEYSVLLEGLKGQSKKRRTTKSTTSSNSSLSTNSTPSKVSSNNYQSSLNVMAKAVETFSAAMLDDKEQKNLISIEEVIEQKLSNIDLYSLLINEKFSNEDAITVIDDIDVLVGFYCTPGIRFEAKYIRDQFLSLGLQLRTTQKVYSLFSKLSQEFKMK